MTTPSPLVDQLKALRQRKGASQETLLALVEKIWKAVEPLRDERTVGTKALPFSSLTESEKEIVHLIEEQKAPLLVAFGLRILHKKMSMTSGSRLGLCRKAMAQGLEKIFSPDMKTPGPVLTQLCKDLTKSGWPDSIKEYLPGMAIPFDTILQKAAGLHNMHERMALRFFALDSVRQNDDKKEEIAKGILVDLRTDWTRFYAQDRLNAYGALMDGIASCETCRKTNGQRASILQQTLEGYMDAVPSLEEGDHKIDAYMSVYGQYRDSKAATGVIGKIMGSLYDINEHPCPSVKPRKRWETLRALSGNSDSRLWGNSSREDIQNALLEETTKARTPEYRLFQLWDILAHTSVGAGEDFASDVYKKMLGIVSQQGAFTPDHQILFCLFLASQGVSKPIQRETNVLFKKALTNMDPLSIAHQHNRLQNSAVAPTMETLFRFWSLSASKDKRSLLMADEQDYPFLNQTRPHEGSRIAPRRLSLETKEAFERTLTNVFLEKTSKVPDEEVLAVTRIIMNNTSEKSLLLTEAQALHNEKTGLTRKRQNARTPRLV